MSRTFKELDKLKPVIDLSDEMPGFNDVSDDEDTRIRNFGTIVYPESAPPNWLEILEGLKVAAFVSPLHDHDRKENGQPKKPHWHVMFMFDGKKSVKQVRKMFAQIGGVGCELVNSMRGYARYMCHLDSDPEKKYRYSIDDVRCFGGSDYADTIGLAKDKYHAIAEMIEYVDKANVRSFSVLLRYASVHRRDWFRVLTDSSTYVVSTYIKSLDFDEVI